MKMAPSLVSLASESKYHIFSFVDLPDADFAPLQLLCRYLLPMITAQRLRTMSIDTSKKSRDRLRQLTSVQYMVSRIQSHDWIKVVDLHASAHEQTLQSSEEAETGVVSGCTTEMTTSADEHAEETASTADDTNSAAPLSTADEDGDEQAKTIIQEDGPMTTEPVLETNRDGGVKRGSQIMQVSIDVAMELIVPEPVNDTDVVHEQGTTQNITDDASQDRSELHAIEHSDDDNDDESEQAVIAANSTSDSPALNGAKTEISITGQPSDDVLAAQAGGQPQSKVQEEAAVETQSSASRDETEEHASAESMQPLNDVDGVLEELKKLQAGTQSAVTFQNKEDHQIVVAELFEHLQQYVPSPTRWNSN